LPVVSQGVNILIATVPSSLEYSTYRIWIQVGSSRSGYKYINQAIGWGFDSSDTYPKAAFSICGQNLYLGKTPTIRFVSQSTGVSLGATFSARGSSAHKLNGYAPSGIIPGQTYDVYLTNGTGPETKVGDTQKALAYYADSIGIGLGWSANLTFTGNIYNIKTDTRLTTKAVGNGSTNDTTAIQGAIDKANTDGGGVVYFPSGTYVIGAGITLKSNVILRGDGKDKTILSYGSIGGSFYLFSLAPAQKNVGLMDCSITCTATTEAYSGGLLQGDNTFLKGVRWSLSKGDWIALYNGNNVAILDCEFSQGLNSTIHGPTYNQNCNHLVLKRNRYSQVYASVDASFSRNYFIENNILLRDNQYLPTGIVHLSVFEFTKGGLIQNNDFDCINGDIARATNGGTLQNDGESIIAEGGGPNAYDIGSGSVTSATATTLTDSSRSWATTFQGGAPVVAIIAGKGSGQHRRIASRTATVLTLSTAWEVTPDNTSVYSIFNFGMQNVAIVGNRFRKQQRGITIYHNATDNVYISHNELSSAGSIDITPIQVIRDSATRQFIPVYNLNIIANRVDGSSNTSDGASIGVHFIQHVTPSPWGTSCINLRIIGNSLEGKFPTNLPVQQDEQFPTGIHAYTVFHIDGQAYVPSLTPSILGSIISSNVIKDCLKGVFLSSGTAHTALRNNTELNVGTLLNNEIISGASLGATNTKP
jgi:hypothetical protein